MQTPELLSDPVFHDEDAARDYLARTRWPEYVVCPLCGSPEKISPLNGESMGKGWWYCGQCQDKFTVRGGTVMERSHIPLPTAPGYERGDDAPHSGGYRRPSKHPVHGRAHRLPPNRQALRPS